MVKAHSILNSVQFFKRVYMQENNQTYLTGRLSAANLKYADLPKLGLTKLHSNMSYEKYLKAESRDFGNEIGDFDIYKINNIF